ncbi:GlxA family transcriptional regulator [Actinomadura flavalba]|uniref:GlxA family transcriptional regulator n=1 Tax=Actinomadura flavalba TaxID=1120938 RepID=UPI00036180B6|nr:DJ-1/PfpI family protein [Actinomadura flavalba]
MEKRRVVVVGYDDAELIDIACVTSALALAGRLGAAPAYEVHVAAVAGTGIRCETGLTLGVHGELAAVRDADTLIVSGGRGHRAAADDAGLVRQVRRLAARSRRVASVCTGATVLAEAGLLDGRRATTHWLYAEELAARYPAVTVDAAPIFVRDGRVSTSGGVTASLDLTLAFIEEDHGPELARRVAMGMVTYLQRPGDQAQMSMFTTARRPGDAVVREVVDHVLAHPGADLSVAALADRASTSPRQLTRLFREHLGESPAAAVRRMRIEIAARLAATTDRPLSQIAHGCGFASAESLRQAFVARFGVSPQTFRASRTRPRPLAVPDAGVSRARG